MRYVPLVKLLVLMGCILSFPAHATTTKNTWYVGFSLLNSKSEYVSPEDMQITHDRSFRSFSIGGESYGQRRIEFDDSAFGYRYFVGVSPNESFDFELGYIDFGKSSATYTTHDVVGTFDRSTLESRVSLKGISAQVQYRQQLSDYDGVEWLARFGMVAWDGQVQNTFVSTGYTGQADKRRKGEVNNRGYDPYFGLGLSYKIDDRWRTRFDIDRYAMGSTETDTATLTLEYRVDWAWF